MELPKSLGYIEHLNNSFTNFRKSKTNTNARKINEKFNRCTLSVVFHEIYMKRYCCPNHMRVANCVYRSVHYATKRKVF